MNAFQEAIINARFAATFLRLITNGSNEADLPGQGSRIQDYFSRDEAMARVPGIRARPSVARVLDTPSGRSFPDLQALAALPEGTLGHTYATTLIAMDFDPSLPDIDARATGSAKNLRDHLAETHDIWHTVTGIGTDTVGEISLQAFQFAQIGAPFHLFAVGMGFLNFCIQHPEDSEALMASVVSAWLLGRRAESLVGIDWSQWWAQDIGAVRVALNIDPAAVAVAVG